MRPERDIGLRELAARQGNVFSLDQARTHGCQAQKASHRVLNGRWHRVHQRVYAFAPELSWRGQVFAALLASGPEAAATHRTAAAVHGLRPSPAIDVTTPRRRRPKKGVISHVATIPAEQLVVVDGIRTTSVERTLLDLADVLRPEGLAKAFREAVRLQALDAGALRGLLHPGCGRSGRAALLALLDQHARHGTVITRSTREELLLALCVRAGLPFPAANVTLGPFEVDALWRDQRVVVEVDTPAFHGDPHALDADSRKRTWLTANGFVVLPVTGGRLQHDPDSVARDLRATLASRSGRHASGT